MTRTRYRAKVDDNHSEIVQGLIAIGCAVADTSTAGEGFPDLVIGYRGRNYLLEVKDGNKAPSRRKLTPEQVRFRDRWRGQWAMVCSLDEAIAAVTK